MEWLCPHCKTELVTPGLGDSAATAGPTPEQAYARCFQCNGYAVVERKSGKAEKIEKPTSSPALSPTIAPLPPLRPIPQRRSEPMTAPLHSPPKKLALNLPPIAVEILQEAPTLKIQPTHPIAMPKNRAVLPWISGSLAAVGALAMAAGIGNTLATSAKPAAPEAKAKVSAANTARANAAELRIAALPKSELKTQSASLTDSIRSAAMAPTRTDPNAPSVPLELQARVGIRALELRGGPGSEFPLLGLADLDERYNVVEWKNGWFKISLEGSRKTAWVAKHQIELYTDVPDGR